MRSEVFRLGLLEIEVVKVILAGTHCAEARAQLVLARPPSTLKELEGVCTGLESLGCYREVRCPGTGVEAGRSDRCFRCDMPGHMARECERTRWGRDDGRQDNQNRQGRP